MENDVPSSVENILRVVNTIACSPTAEEQSSALQNLVTATRRSFRPNYGGNDARRRGRRINKSFKRKIFLMKLAHCDFLPGRQEQKYFKQRGLGLCNHMIEIDRIWSYIRIKQQIVNMYPNNIQDLLRMSDFKLAKSDRQKKLIHLQLTDRFNGYELEEKLGSGLLIVIPNHDFPNNLPIIGTEPGKTATSDQDDSDFETPVSRRPRVEVARQSVRHRLTLAAQPLHTAINASSSASQSAEHFAPTSSVVPSLDLMQELPYLSTTYTEDGYEHFDQSQASATMPDIIFPTVNANADVKLITIKRQNVVESMFELYRANEEITGRHLSVKFIDEEGVDGGGLTLELFTVFWTEIFTSQKYFVGNDVLVPHVPLHKLKKVKSDFEILGRILGHMLLVTGTFPNKLAMYTFTALSQKKEDYSHNKKALLQDFFLFLTIAERKLLQKALEKFETLSETEMSRLTNLFSANNLLDVPRASDIEEQIITIAEKVIIKDTNELFVEMRQGLPTEILEFLNNIPLEDIIQIWTAKQPTAEKVMNVLKLVVEFPNNHQEKTFFYLQNYVGSLPISQLSKFLLFVTASIHMPHEILVTFHEYVGLGRRPIVHTCSNTIELGVAYESQQEFDAEMNLYLNDITSFEYDQM